MRKLHRKLGLIFGPFLMTSAVTGLLWAYAPHLYLKQEPAKKETVKASRIVLMSADGREARSIDLGAETPVTVDPWSVQYRKRQTPVFHQWIMRIHRLEFFGAKKELTIFPGIGALLLGLTGFVLLKKGGKNA
jgi:uncharacterized iron-regulated membrane protein